MSALPHDFGERYYGFFKSLPADLKVPEGVEVLFPYGSEEVLQTVRTFAEKFMKGEHKRTFLLGINPGRFGAGVTGISFTDPVHLEKNLGIQNNFEKRAELSSTFIHEMIEVLGGPEVFYKHFYIGSVCPLGFVKNGKNLNYYDEKDLENTLSPHIVDWMNKQVNMGANRNIAYSIGKGKNLKFLKKLNAKHGWFREIKSIPHPRWVLQYKLKYKGEILNDINSELSPLMF